MGEKGKQMGTKCLETLYGHVVARVAYKRGRRGLCARSAMALTGGVLSVALAGCGSGAPTASKHVAQASLSGTVTAEFDAGLTFDDNSLGVTWWDHVAAEFHHAYPKAHLKLTNISGNLSAYTTKLGLQFRTPSSAPDVVQINSQYLGEFASGGDLLALNKYIQGGAIPGWSTYPANVKAEDTIGGKVYGIDEGENIAAVFYNKALLKKAGIALPWKPETWKAILSAGEAVKLHDSGVYPIGLAAGTSTAAGGIAQGTGNLLDGTTTPQIYTKGRWVVSSPGLKQTFGFYKSLFGQGLGVPVSYLFASNAIGELPTLMSEGKLAIAIGENWYPGTWAIKGSGATWPAAPDLAGVAPMPTRNGQAPGSASTLQGWAVAVNKAAPDQRLALGLLKIMQSEGNVVSLANTAGFVPPEPSFARAKAFVEFAPLQGTVAAYLPVAKGLPSYEPGYAAWVRGVEDATAQLASDPSGTTVSKAVGLVRSTVAGELGSSKVITLP